jgi:hypothetical protein
MYSRDFQYKYIDTLYQDWVNQIGIGAEKYLRYLPREIPEFPSHGPDHSINIIDMIMDFVNKWDANLSEEEIFLLYVSAWVHDMGCLICRNDHQKHSVTMLDRTAIVREILGEELYTCLKYIVKYHSSDEDLKEVPKKWGRIELQKVCAIFRLLDACDITEIKCPKGVYEIIKISTPPLSKTADEYWNAHMSIESLTFECPKIKIFVNNYEKCKFLIEKLEREISKDVADILIANGVSCPIVECITIPSTLDE